MRWQNQNCEAESPEKRRKENAVKESESMAAKSKDDIRYGTAQAKLSEDEALRVRYKSGTPLEGGKIADSEPVDLFPGASNISRQQEKDDGKLGESETVELFSAARHIEKQKQLETRSGGHDQVS